MHVFKMAVLVAASVAIASVASAAPTLIQPNEAASKDTFVYSAIPSGFEFSNSNILGASLESSGVHTVNSLIQFDLSGASINGGETAKLLIRTRSKTGTPFSSVASDPSPANPVTVDVYAITSPWAETVTWSNQPTVGSTAIASFVVQNINQVYSVDITSAVAGWLANTASNNGIELRQRSIVTTTGGPDAAVVFDSASGTFGPALSIAAPEPVTLASLAGVSMLVGGRRRRAAR